MSPPKSWPSLCLSVHSLFTLVSLDSEFELRAAMDNRALDGLCFAADWRLVDGLLATAMMAKCRYLHVYNCSAPQLFSS